MDNDNTKTEDDNEANLPAVAPRSGWQFAADTVRKSCKAYEPAAQENLWWLFQWGISEEIPFHEAAKRVKYNSNTLYKIFTGRYKGPGGGMMPIPKRLINAIASLRTLEMKRQALGKTEFVKTPTVNNIWNLCDMARTSNTIAMLYGKSHTGKSWALINYQKSHNHGSTLYIRIPAGGGKMELLKAIARSIGVPDSLSFDKLKPRVLKAINKDMLVIFDELHEFNIAFRKDHKWACIELIREIHDQTKCGMVLCGTHIWRDELDIGRDKDLLEQLERRGLYQLEIGDEPSKADLTAICKAFGLAYPVGEDADTLRTISQTRGLLAVTEVLRKGSSFAKRAEQKLEWSHVMKAWRIIQNMKRKPKFN